MTLEYFVFLPLISGLYFRWDANIDYVWVSEPMTWEVAENYCKSTFSTNLASIHDSTHNTAVNDLCAANTGTYCFIGLNDRDIEGQWVWTDQTPLDYGPNWYAPNPGDTGLPGEDCVGILPSVGWGDHFCDTTYTPYTFICNAPKQPIFVWSENMDYVWAGPIFNMDWYNTNAYCQSMFDTTLAIIHSEAENIDATNLCDSMTDVSCFIGLSDTTGPVQWIDGSNVDYTPDTNNYVDRCAVTRLDIQLTEPYKWGDVPCTNGNGNWSFVCNAPFPCQDIMHINWDLIVNDVNNDQMPVFNVTLDVDETELSVNVDVDLQYLGYSYADNGVYGYGTTYFISFNSFSSNTVDIFSDNGLSECDNRVSSSFMNTSWTDKWAFSETPYVQDHVGSDQYLAYPFAGNFWNLTTFGIGSGHKCDRINYFGSFSWFDLQTSCKNPQTNKKSVDILVDNDWINLTGTVYINIISPLTKDIDSGMYRIYELTNEKFTIAVSKSVNIISSTGISLYKISIMTINTEQGEFKLDIITEAADYLQLSSESLLITPNGYQFNISPLNNGDCLSYKSNICVQSWQISTTHNKTCNDFGGIYAIQWIAQCNHDIVNNTRCLSHNGNEVILSVETDYKDETCDTTIGKVQFEGEMSFYTNDSFIGNSNNDYLFIVGKDTIYVEIVLDYPSNTYSIFNSKLINVWLCTIDDEIYGSTFSISQTNPLNTGCLSSIIDNDGYNPYWIIQNYDQSFEHNAEHINGSNSNIIRFKFKAPYTLTRDTLWIHAQIELSFIDNNRRLIRRALIDTDASSVGQMRHFGSSINIENAITDDEITTIISSTAEKEQTDNVFFVKPTFYVVLFSFYCFLL